MAGRYRILGFLLTCLVMATSVYSHEIVNSFRSPGSEPRGLAWDGRYLWCADADMDLIYRLDPSDGTVISSVPYPVNSWYGGLAWGGDSTLWIANGGIISRIDTAKGGIVSEFSCPGG